MPPGPRAPRLTADQRRAQRDVRRINSLIARGATAEQLAEATGRPLAWAQRVLEARGRRAEVPRRQPPPGRGQGRPNAQGPQP